MVHNSFLSKCIFIAGQISIIDRFDIVYAYLYRQRNDCHLLLYCNNHYFNDDNGYDDNDNGDDDGDSDDDSVDNDDGNNDDDDDDDEDDNDN